MLYAFKLGRKLRGEEPYCPEKGGKGGSSDKSAKYAAEAQKYAADLQNQQWQTIMKNLAPFTPLAEQYVNQLQNLSSLEGQGQALNQYYNSQQYKDLAGQARYQSLAAAEATGGLGSTATSNQLKLHDCPDSRSVVVVEPDEQLQQSGKHWPWCSARSGKRRADVRQQHEQHCTAKRSSCRC